MKTKMISNSALVAALVLLAASTGQATVRLGNPYTPTGANYTITAKQGVDSTNGSGGTTNGAQVNRDFEFNGTLGVTYTQANGTPKDFGIGIYTSGGVTYSSGLQIQLNQPSIASGVTATLADFDLSSTATFFNPNKVEARVLVFSGTQTFSFDPRQVFASLVNTTGPNGNEDYWNLNFGTLLSNSGVSGSTAISGFLLYADSLDREKNPSDPYFLTSLTVSAVPEPSTYLGGLVIVALLVGTHAKAVLKKQKENV